MDSSSEMNFEHMSFPLMPCVVGTEIMFLSSGWPALGVFTCLLSKTAVLTSLWAFFVYFILTSPD